MSPVLVGLFLSFAVLANGAHDLWAATPVYLASGIWVVAELWRASRPDSRGFPKDFLPWLALLGAALLASFIRSANSGDAFMGFLDWSAGMACFLTALCVFRQPGTTDSFALCMIPVFAIELGLMLWQQLHGRHPFREMMPGTLLNSNFTAAFLLLWLPIFMRRTERALASRESRLPYWVAGLTLNLLAFIAASSTWGWICLAVGLPWLGGIESLKSWISRHWVKATVLGAAVIVLAGSAVVWKFTRLYYRSGDLVPAGEGTMRLYWWLAALKMFVNHPWTGVGVGNYSSAFLAFKVGPVTNTLYSHNFPLSMLAETGVFGFGATVAFLAFWTRRLPARCGELEERRPYLIGIVMFLLFSLVNLSIECLANLLAFWLFLAVAVAPTIRARWKPRPSAVIVAGVLFAAAFPYIAAPLQAGRLLTAGYEDLHAGRLGEAKKEFTAAAGLDGLSFEPQRGLARTYYMLYNADRESGDLDKAIEAQQKAIDRNQLQGFLWWEFGNYLKARGNDEEAEEIYRHAGWLGINDIPFRIQEGLPPYGGLYP